MRPFVLSQEAFEQGGNDLAHALHLTKTANALFRLGHDPGVFQEIERARNAVTELHAPILPTLWDLHFIAASKQLSDEIWDQVYGEDRMTGTPDEADVFRKFGFAKIADVLEENYALIDAFEFEIIGPNEEFDGPAYVEIKNKDVLEAKQARLSQQLADLVDQSGLGSMDRVLQSIPTMKDISLVPYAEFQRHWIDEIVQSDGFRAFEAPKRTDDGWYMNSEPYGWLTVRHGAALKAHGYSYLFAFWEEELGPARGHLWIQTDRGPLRLTDPTDSTWMSSVFPVRVSTISGEPLFELQETDVPARLLRKGPDVPKDLTSGMFALTVDVPIQRKGALSRWFS